MSSINRLHRYMHPSSVLSARQVAAGWLLLIGQPPPAVAAGFCRPSPALQFIVSSSSSARSSHHTHTHSSRAAFKSNNNLLTARRNSNDIYAADSYCKTTPAVTMTELPTKWSDASVHQNPNYDANHLFPPLSSSSHKGSHGRIAILGGSDKYTGAPYYAAQAALNCGVDLATVFCADEAAVPIKCYSPELMVQGVYSIERFDLLLKEEEALLKDLETYNHKSDSITVDDYNNWDDTSNNISPDKLLLEHDSSHKNELFKTVDDNKMINDIVNELQKVKLLQESLQELQLRQAECIAKSVNDVTSMFPSLHALCVGPGLGRHPLVFKVIQPVLQKAIESKLTLILDADVLFMLSLVEYRELLEKLLRYERCIMTPNVMEMKRLPSFSSFGVANSNNNIIVKKGYVDTVSRGAFEMQCAEEGGLKRSGGIGDVLAGTISAYSAWCAILERVNNEENDVQGLTQQLAFAVWTACCTVKRATKVAFENKRRAMSSKDVLNEICGVIMQLEIDIKERKQIY